MPHQSDRRHPLSPREREILLWSCRGKTYDDIAQIAGLSNGTVKRYLDTARHKLNVVNLIQACATAVAEGIFTSEEILNRPEAEVPSSSPTNGRRRPRNPP